MPDHWYVSWGRQTATRTSARWMKEGLQQHVSPCIVWTASISTRSQIFCL
jgi:hypothetical protein